MISPSLEEFLLEDKPTKEGDKSKKIKDKLKDNKKHSNSNKVKLTFKMKVTNFSISMSPNHDNRRKGK